MLSPLERHGPQTWFGVWGPSNLFECSWQRVFRVYGSDLGLVFLCLVVQPGGFSFRVFRNRTVCAMMLPATAARGGHLCLRDQMDWEFVELGFQGQSERT